MVVNVTVTEDEWSRVGIITRQNFNVYLCDILDSFVGKLDDCERSIIKLPKTTTTEQRYTIHRLTTVGFNSYSHYNEHNDRIMEIELSKEYVRGLFANHQFETINFKTDREELLETMMEFINKNLEPEFKGWLNKF